MAVLAEQPQSSRMDSLPRRTRPVSRAPEANLRPYRSERAQRMSREAQTLTRVPRQGVLGQTRSAVTMALQARRAVKQGDLSAFSMAFAFALSKDGLLDFIPFVGNILGLFISIYLFVFLFGRGKWKVRLAVFVLTLLEVIPGINFIPFQTICVYYAYHQAKKDNEEALRENATAVAGTLYAAQRRAEAANDSEYRRPIRQAA